MCILVRFIYLNTNFIYHSSIQSVNLWRRFTSAPSLLHTSVAAQLQTLFKYTLPPDLTRYLYMIVEDGIKLAFQFDVLNKMSALPAFISSCSPAAQFLPLLHSYVMLAS